MQIILHKFPFILLKNENSRNFKIVDKYLLILFPMNNHLLILHTFSIFIHKDKKSNACT